MKFFVLRYIKSIKKPIERNFLWFFFTYILGAFCNIVLAWNGSRIIGLFQLFLDLYIIVAIGSLLPQKIWNAVKWCLNAFFYTLCIIDLFCWFRLSSPISPTLLTTFLQTNSNEAKEALMSYIEFNVVIKMLPLIILPALHIAISYSKKATSYISNLTSKISYISTYAIPLILTISLTLCLKNEIYLFYRIVLGYSEKNTYIASQIEPNVRFYTPVHRFLNAIRERGNGKNTIEQLHANLENSTVRDCDFKSKNIILIIGESYNRHHSQLYGYDKATTPLQIKHKEDGSLVVFKDVIALHNLTNEVFASLLSTHCVGDSTEWFNYPLFTTLFRNAGYNVSFYSNQYIPANSNSYSDFNEDIIINDSRMSSAQFSQRNSMRYTYDAELIEKHHTLPSKSKGNLLIYHLMGQHIDFESRYPDNFNHFNENMYDDKEIGLRRTIAHYDNATLYNDYVLDCIINRFKKEDAIIIHIADHGERTCDDGGGFGRSFSYGKGDIKQQYEIPFWIYTTEKYKESHPDIVQCLNKAKDLPLCTDNVAHLLLYLGGISTEHYKEDYNPLSPTYNTSLPRIINNEFNYDEFVKEHI